MIRKLLLLIRSLFLFFSNSSKERSFTLSLRMLCLGMFFVVSFVNATNYYSFSNGSPSDVNNWWSNTNGTGGHPSNFNSASDTFFIQSGNTMTTVNGGNWIVAGTVTVMNGGTLNITTNNSSGSFGNFNVNNGGNSTVNRVLTVSGLTSISGTLTIGATGLKHLLEM